MRKVVRSFVVGGLIGLLPVSAPQHLPVAGILRLGFGTPFAQASSCASGGSRPSYFAGDDFVSQNAHTIWVTISTDSNSSICDSTHGVSYWGMVVGPSTNCPSAGEGPVNAFVQTGWLVGDKNGKVTKPTFFYEAQAASSTSGYCDQGATLVEPVTASSLTYKTSILTEQQYPSYRFGWFAIAGQTDPYCPCTQPIDWNNINGSKAYEEFAESHDLNTYWSGGNVNFTNIQYSSDTFYSVGTPSTNRTASSTNLGSPTNQYANYVSQEFGSNSFMICDTRVTTSLCSNPHTPTP